MLVIRFHFCVRNHDPDNDERDLTYGIAEVSKELTFLDSKNQIVHTAELRLDFPHGRHHRNLVPVFPLRS